MKIYVVVSTYIDDEGETNFDLHGVFFDPNKAKMAKLRVEQDPQGSGNAPVILAPDVDKFYEDPQEIEDL